jgi:hypothetical protein
MKPILVGCLMATGFTAAVLYETAKAETHHHRISDLRLMIVRILEVKNAKIVFQNLEEDSENQMAIRVHEIEVDKDFRLFEAHQDSNQEATLKLLGLVALNNSEGILTVCDGCHRALAMRIGELKF